MGDMGEGALHEEESNGQIKKIKTWSWAKLADWP
jgi:hypothetical protein